MVSHHWCHLRWAGPSHGAWGRASRLRGQPHHVLPWSQPWSTTSASPMAPRASLTMLMRASSPPSRRMQRSSWWDSLMKLWQSAPLAQRHWNRGRHAGSAFSVCQACAACQSRSLDTGAAHATCCASGEATRGQSTLRLSPGTALLIFCSWPCKDYFKGTFTNSFCEK